jgi:hypothetical protein
MESDSRDEDERCEKKRRDIEIRSRTFYPRERRSTGDNKRYEPKPESETALKKDVVRDRTVLAREETERG